ncbi:fimbria/pilus outer membrane usher protein [Enterobacter sp.]|uniref:fimbria/pilus outer membrane usher protein n=1 Tax=Enterobacter sp. TaxID=42895 RepID=UPI00296E6FF7|nr:fimbria/pilus outer membrane usher protein [Enterobacter sp.]
MSGYPYAAAGLMIALLLAHDSSRAADRFNAAALEIDNPQDTGVDLSAFSQPDSQAAGVYRVDIEINGTLRGHEDVRFARSQSGALQPQFSVEKWQALGVNTALIPGLHDRAATEILTEPQQDLPGVIPTFDFARQRLCITIPQALIDFAARGSVDPALWDNGIPALLLNYAMSGTRTRYTRGGTEENHFLALRSGANLGGWRLRNASTLSDTAAGRDFSTSYSYVQHDVRALRGQFIAGDSSTPSEVFDSVPLRGMQLASDDTMLPESLRGYAPTIRGIVRTSATVTVRQHGNLIYQTSVPPGAFVIDDLYPTSASGDLAVTIAESNGESHTFSQPFSAVPVMQREKRLKYAFSAGKYHGQTSDAPTLAQGTLIYGLPHGMTIFGGSQTSAPYQALDLGVGAMLGAPGSVSFDTTWAHAQTAQGQLFRLQYAKTLTTTGTTFSAGASLYGGDFYSFTDTRESDADAPTAKKSQLRMSLTQSLNDGQAGNLSLSGYQSRYRNASNDERTWSLSYNLSLHDISYALTLSDSRSQESGDDRQLALSVSIPLAPFLPDAWATMSTSGAQYQAGISGSLLSDNNLSYSLTEGDSADGQGRSGNLNATWLNSAGQLGGGYNYSRDNRQVNYSLQGSLLAHADGITAGQPLPGEMSALALVKAPGAAGVKVANSTGLYTDRNGYALVRYLSPYQPGQVALDTTTLASNVDLTSSVTSVVPSAGSVVLATFDTHTGARMLATLRTSGGTVPFGALATLAGRPDISGMVDEQSQVYLSGLPANGQLRVTWEQGECIAPFALPVAENNRVVQLTALCQ